MLRTEHDTGGYSYLPGLPFASNGVTATPGMTIEHAVLPQPQPLPNGLDHIRRHLDRMGRPLHALCGLELRLPAALPMPAFRDFNEQYLALLDKWGLLRAGTSPLTRTNVVPSVNPPAAPTLLAFSYTTARKTSGPPCLVITGVAELTTGARFPDDVVRHGEVGIDALLEKAAYIIGEVNARITALGACWERADRVQLYCAHRAVFEIGRQVLGRIGAQPAHGLTWHDSTPPVLGLELEIDVRRHTHELIMED